MSVSILGTRVIRTEDPRFLTTGGVYTDDMRLPGACHVHFVRSAVAHARIRSVDVSAALEAPGVIAAFTGADLAELPVPDPPMAGMINAQMGQPLLAADVVRYVGEPVAVVVTEQRYQGEDAGDLVDVDYDMLTPVIDMTTAADDDGAGAVPGGGHQRRRHHGRRLGPGRGPVRRVRGGRLPHDRQPAGRARADGDPGRGRVLGRGRPAAPRGSRTRARRAPARRWPACSASTRPSCGSSPRTWAARSAPSSAPTRSTGWSAGSPGELGRPARWAETRNENLVGMTHGRAQIQKVTIGGSRDGTVGAYRIEILQDSGAYPRFGAFLPFLTILMAPGPYAFPRAEAVATSVVTNTTPVGAYRGAGRPEATAAVERAMDLFAAEIGVDPAEVRRKNLLPAFTEPHTTAFGAVYDSGDYVTALDRALAAAGYEDLRAEQAKRRASGEEVQLGIGLSCYVEITGVGGEAGGAKENATVEVHPDGSATILTGTSPHGQGHQTVWAMLASEELGIPVDRITLKWGDTDLIPEGGGTGGSRSLQQGGAAVQQASRDLLDVARQRAADELEA